MPLPIRFKGNQVTTAKGKSWWTATWWWYSDSCSTWPRQWGQFSSAHWHWYTSANVSSETNKMEALYHMSILSIQLLGLMWVIAIAYSIFCLYIPLENFKMYRQAALYTKMLRDRLYAELFSWEGMSSFFHPGGFLFNPIPPGHGDTCGVPTRRVARSRVPPGAPRWRNDKTHIENDKTVTM